MDAVGVGDRHAVVEETVEEVLTATDALAAVDVRSLAAGEDELSVAQYRALHVLAAQGPQRNVDLAEALHVNPSTAARMCDRLARKGFLTRRRAETDRRTVLLVITPAGQSALDEATGRKRVFIARALSKLSGRRQRSVARALHVLSEAVEHVSDVKLPDDR